MSRSRSLWALVAILAALIAYVGIATAANAWLPQFNHSQAYGAFPDNHLVQAMVRWDSGWYAGIAEEGYWYQPGKQSPVAFFPAYPMAVRAVRWLGVHSYVAGILVSAVCGVLAMWLFFAWARRLVGSEKAFPALTLFLVYPFVFYVFGVMYPEALFLSLVIPAFLFLERGNVWLATLFGVLATTCRPVAPAVVMGLVARQIELRLQRGERVRPVDFVPVLAAAGMGGYMAFLGLEFGDPLAFVHVQSAPGWDHEPGWRTWLKVQWFKEMFPRVDPEVGFRLGLHAALTLGALALLVPMKRRLGWGYTIYSAIAVAIPAAGIKDFHGMGRYVMAAFPCVLTLSLLIGERAKLRAGVMIVSAGMGLWWVVRFAQGGWPA